MTQTHIGFVPVLPLLLVLAIAACASPPSEPLGSEDWTDPPQQPGPVELIGHWTTATHAGDRGVSTHPADTAADTPAFCIAYLDDRTRAEDECRVSTRPFEWEGGQTYPWTVRATWTTLQAWDDQTVDRLAIHAFDAAGQPLAYWTGRMDPHAGHLTE